MNVGIPTITGDQKKLGPSTPSKEGSDNVGCDPRFLGLGYSPGAQQRACPLTTGSVWFWNRPEELTGMFVMQEEATEVALQSKATAGRARRRLKPRSTDVHCAAGLETGLNLAQGAKTPYGVNQSCLLRFLLEAGCSHSA